MNNTIGVISCPRYGPLINSHAMLEAFGPLDIPMIKHQGPWWHHSLSELMEQAIAEGKEYVMGLDYDTVFNVGMVRALLALIGAAPQADAVCAVQSHRDKHGIMADPLEKLAGPFTRCRQAHFGLTVFRTKALDTLPRPWFVEKPNKEGRWAEGKTDADIGFWQNWYKAGKVLYQANNVPIGHLVEAIAWPGKDGRTIFQNTSDWYERQQPPPGVFGT